MTDVSFHELLVLARGGDDPSAARIVREFEPELQRYIRFRLTHPGVRRFIDSLDICQSVLATFFAHLQSGRFDLITPRQLFRLLGMMADNKVRDKVRREHAVRRGEGVRPIEIGTCNTVAVGPEVDPAELVADRELVTAIQDRLPQADRMLVDRWLAGDGWAEIAVRFGGTPEAIRKRVSRAIDRAAQEIGLIEDSV